MDPSVKGSLVIGAAVATRRHRSAGRISQEELDARLSGTALELIDDRKIEIGRWYPVAAFCELLDLDWQLASDRDPEHARKAGTVSADQLFDSGIYQQLDYAERAERVKSRADLTRQARLITTITGTLYNFLEFEVKIDEQETRSLEIHYRNATAFAEVLRFNTEGFMNQINRRQGSPRQWTSERVQTDLVIFRLPLPTRLTDPG